MSYLFQCSDYLIITHHLIIEDEGERNMGHSRKKEPSADCFQEEKNLARKYMGKKSNPTMVMNKKKQSS